ncbi:MAG: hypothetical protein PHR35_01795 [Kiritimatiellae bacterium]|nr:hypothetical protein [Kiritimatiellia bacterium]
MKKPIQYTLRGIPECTDRRLREAAVEYGTSLNGAAVEALNRGSGTGAEPVVHHDLDDLIGSWVSDPDFDKALADMDKVDPESWA